MSRKIPFLAVAAAAAGMIGAGAAEAAERSFPTGGDIHAVSNSTPFDVYVHTGQAAGIHASGTDEALDRLEIRNEGGQLRIGSKSGGWFSGWHWSGQKARIDVTVPMIGEVSVAGPGNLTVDTVRTRDFGMHLSGPGNINVGSVEASGVTLNLSGPGDIRVAGHADRAVVHLSGPGNIHAGSLTLSEADVTLSGPGDIDATVTRTANVSLSGPGDVRIQGGAHCNVQKSGPGDVHCG
jgi:hypothetical protein